MKNDMKRKTENKKQLLAKMPRRPSLFWDVDPKRLDPDQHPRYVIERILDFGLDPEVRWLTRYYPKQAIVETIENSRILQPKTRKLWETLLLKQ